MYPVKRQALGPLLDSIKGTTIYIYTINYMNESINFKKPKNNQEHTKDLNFSMGEIADKTNKRFGLDLLDSRGAVNPDALGGLNEKEINFIDNRVKYWSKVEDPDARETFAKFHNLQSASAEELTAAMTEHWLKEKENGKSAMLEMLVTVVFYKALGDKYLVMRSSEIDDYSNGIDMIILNTETNEIICAFDEVHDRKTGNRLIEKNQKIIKQAQKGGTSADYVPKIVNGKVERAKFSNVPNFYVALDIDELNEALEKVNCKDLENMSDFERSLFTKFASAIIQQSEMLLQQPSIPQVIKDRLKKVSAFFNDRK